MLLVRGRTKLLIMCAGLALSHMKPGGIVTLRTSPFIVLEYTLHCYVGWILGTGVFKGFIIEDFLITK